MEGPTHDNPALTGHPSLEKALLGRLLLGHRGSMVDLPKVKPHRFVVPKHQVVYAAILSQSKRHAPYDLASITEWLDREGYLGEAGGREYLARLIDFAGPVGALDSYALTITQASARRLCSGLARSLEALALEAPGERTEASLQMRLKSIRGRMDAVLHFRPDTGGLRSEQAGDVYRRAAAGPPWLMAPWLAQEDFVICVGEQGIGKSWVALQLAACLASGHSMLDDVQRQPRRVLYVDAENNPQLVTYRVRRLANGLGLDAESMDRMPLWYADVSRVGLALDTDEGIAALEEECRRRQPEVVILDSLMDFQDRDENSNTEMKRWMNRMLRPFASRHKVAVVALHHMSKPNKEAGDRSAMHRGRGASAITGIADQVWSLERRDDVMLLQHEKCRWGLEASPLEMVLEDVNDGNGCRLGVIDHEEVVSELAERILRVLGGGGVTRSHLEKSVNEMMDSPVNARTLQRAVMGLVKAGKVWRQRSGKESVYSWAVGGPKEPPF